MSLPCVLQKIRVCKMLAPHRNEVRVPLLDYFVHIIGVRETPDCNNWNTCNFLDLTSKLYLESLLVFNRGTRIRGIDAYFEICVSSE
ncbi:MAG: hypothetical protein RBG13Loki_2784 [Promethearchaeota archaeon CR_4]|nr:MAG: hypothetical protein RBG13Loki_2784 [Candidatus Lokiarchaeota archaeon CR_4]